MSKKQQQISLVSSSARIINNRAPAHHNAIAVSQEQRRKDIEKYAESIFYSARYSGELQCELVKATAF